MLEGEYLMASKSMSLHDDDKVSERGAFFDVAEEGKLGTGQPSGQ